MARRALWLLLGLAVGCKPTAQAPAPSSMPVTAASEDYAAPGPTTSASAAPSGSAWADAGALRRPPEAQVASAWKAMVVRNHKPAQRVLYTWTTAGQEEELRASRKLLLKGSNDGNGMSLYDSLLWQSYQTDPWSRLLLNPPFHLTRYAWPWPWATRLGGDSKPYGDTLVQIKLKPEALVAVFYPSRQGNGRWSFHDMEGRAVPGPEALRQAGRVAAVLHVNDADTGQAQRFREYVVCNEAMIEEWSIATDDIRRELASEQQAVEQLAQLSDGRRGWAEPLAGDALAAWVQGAATLWESPDAASLEELYIASLAFANDRYQPAAARLFELAASLRGPKLGGGPFSHRPSVAAPRSVALPPPLPPPRRIPGCRPDGTFSCLQSDVYPCRNDSGKIIPCPP